MTAKMDSRFRGNDTRGKMNIADVIKQAVGLSLDFVGGRLWRVLICPSVEYENI